MTLWMDCTTGAKPVLGPDCMEPYVKIYGIIQFGLKMGLAHMDCAGNPLQPVSQEVPKHSILCCLLHLQAFDISAPSSGRPFTPLFPGCSV